MFHVHFLKIRFQAHIAVQISAAELKPALIHGALQDLSPVNCEDFRSLEGIDGPEKLKFIAKVMDQDHQREIFREQVQQPVDQLPQLIPCTAHDGILESKLPLPDIHSCFFRSRYRTGLYVESRNDIQIAPALPGAGIRGLSFFSFDTGQIYRRQLIPADDLTHPIRQE